MSKEIILNALDGIQDRYITEAAGRLGLLNGSASALNRRRESALSRFFGSGWGVAMICAVVSLSVLGGIIVVLLFPYRLKVKRNGDFEIRTLLLRVYRKRENQDVLEA